MSDSSRVALVTGCSSGIGAETAKQLLENDWTVYATARDTDSLDELWNAGAKTHEVDVTRFEDIHRITQTIATDHGQLDLLVNNAGYGQFGAVPDVPTPRVRDQFDVNVFGVHRLINETMPLLRSANGTIISLSSIVAAVHLPGMGAYTASKAALEAHHDSLRVEVANEGVSVVLIEPGPVNTNFSNRTEESLAELELTDAYKPVYDFLRDDESSSSLEGSSPESVAGVIVDAAQHSNPPARIPVGKWTGLLMWASRVAPTRARDWLVNRVLR